MELCTIQWMKENSNRLGGYNVCSTGQDPVNCDVIKIPLAKVTAWQAPFFCLTFISLVDNRLSNLLYKKFRDGKHAC